MTNAELERLAILVEEAGEVIQACGKILRHGMDNYHPVTKESNRDVLSKELADLQYAIDMIGGDMNNTVFTSTYNNRKDKLLRYTYFQDESKGTK